MACLHMLPATDPHCGTTQMLVPVSISTYALIPCMHATCFGGCFPTSLTYFWPAFGQPPRDNLRTSCSGYREACDVARKRIEGAAQSHAGNEQGLRKALLDIARTTLSSKILTHDKEHFAQLAVDAVLRLKGSTNLDSIHVIKKAGGTLRVGNPSARAMAWDAAD